MVKAHAVFLAQTLVLIQHVHRRFEITLHAIRIAARHNVFGVDGGINADHIEQIGRSHRPAKTFHYFIDLPEVSAITQQGDKAGKVREQHPVDHKSGAVINHHRRLTHFTGIGDHRCDSLLGCFTAANHLHQRHGVYRIKKVHATELFRTLQVGSQFINGNG